MTEKTELYNKYVAYLVALDIPRFHIPNSAFTNRFAGAWGKSFPDIMFAYNGKVYMREFGIKGRHKGRKKLQKEFMERWAEHGNVDIKLLYDWTVAEEDIVEILGK
jgi:hypothetical protein